MSALERAGAAAAQMERASITFDLSMKGQLPGGFTVPPESSLHLELALAKGVVDPGAARVRFVDAAGKQVAPSRTGLHVSGIELERHDNGQAAVIAVGKLGFFPVRKTVFDGLPLDVAALLVKLGQMGQGPKDAAGNSEPARYHYRMDGVIAANRKIALNEGTSLTTGDAAEIQIAGSPQHAVATLKGRGMQIQSSMLSTGPSDIAVRVSLSREPQGRHVIAFDNSCLRQLRFRVSDMDAPAINALRIQTSEPFGFQITIDPHDTFTMSDLIAKLAERVKNPDAIAHLKEKFQGASAGPVTGEIVLDSARWNIVDYITHDLKGDFAAVRLLPNVAEEFADAAVQRMSTESTPHLRAFIFGTQLQLATAYDAKHLATLAHQLLAPPVRQAMEPLEAQIAVVEAQLPGAKGGDWAAAKTIEAILRGVGNALNARERKWLRQAWVDAGGMESEGRAYALLSHLIGGLMDSIAADAAAPAALKGMLANEPHGAALDQKIAVAADNLRGAIWAAQGVLKDGWEPISKHLEDTLATLYHGAPSFPGEGSLNTEVRFAGNGEEFFQQIVKLLDDNIAAGPQGPVALNYWAIESYVEPDGAPNVWGLRIADKIEELGAAGFVVSVLVDEKNGPSRKGQARLREVSEKIGTSGPGRVYLNCWTPRPESFPQGTHVKYLASPLGVIAGGSNMGDNYAHWSDTNFLLRGPDAVRHYWSVHRAVLAEQAAAGQSAPTLPEMPVLDPALWSPLTTYQRAGAATPVFDADWEPVALRTFRDQGGDADDRILVELLAALDAARPKETVYIGNAYLVLTQPIEAHPLARGFRRALARGVNLEILTNSAESSDEPSVVAPIVKSVFLLLDMARDLNAGTLTVHLPAAEYMEVDEHKKPLVTIHDKTFFHSNLAFVMTANLHPRSFTLEQELLTEMVGTSAPKALGNAPRQFLEYLRTQKGGDRIVDIDALLAPISGIPPLLWGPSSTLYLLWLEKRFRYCCTFVSTKEEDLRSLAGWLDKTPQASLADLMIDVV